MNIYEFITYIISPEMIDAMGECAYQRLLFCSGLFAFLFPFLLCGAFVLTILTFPIWSARK